MSDDLIARMEREQAIRDNPELRCHGVVRVNRSLPKVCLPSLTELEPCANAAVFRLVYTVKSGQVPRKACVRCAGLALVPEIIHSMTRIDGQEPFNYVYM